MTADPIDNIVGLAGNDELFGNEGIDVLNGGTQNDLLDGGASVDTADYSNILISGRPTSGRELGLRSTSVWLERRTRWGPGVTRL